MVGSQIDKINVRYNYNWVVFSSGHISMQTHTSHIFIVLFHTLLMRLLYLKLKSTHHINGKRFRNIPSKRFKPEQPIIVKKNKKKSTFKVDDLEFYWLKLFICIPLIQFPQNKQCTCFLFESSVSAYPPVVLRNFQKRNTN